MKSVQFKRACMVAYKEITLEESVTVCDRGRDQAHVTPYFKEFIIFI